MPHHVRPGRNGIADWAKETIGSFLRDRRFVETRRIIQGHVAAWEGIWEAATTSPEQVAKLPLVMVIEFNEGGRSKAATPITTRHIFSNLFHGDRGLRVRPGVVPAPFSVSRREHGRRHAPRPTGSPAVAASAAALQRCDHACAASPMAREARLKYIFGLYLQPMKRSGAACVALAGLR